MPYSCVFIEYGRLRCIIPSIDGMETAMKGAWQVADLRFGKWLIDSLGGSSLTVW